MAHPKTNDYVITIKVHGIKRRRARFFAKMFRGDLRLFGFRAEVTTAHVKDVR